MLLILCLFCIRSSNIMSNGEKLDRLDGINDTVNVTVISTQSLPEQSFFGSCTVRVNQSSYLNKNDTIVLRINGAPNLEIGDEFTLPVTYSKLHGDYKLSYYSEGIYIGAYANDNFEKITTQKGLYGLAGKLRKHINKRILNNTDNAPVLMSVLTGERAYMSQKFYDMVKASGVSHILVVSGMHLAIITISIEKIFQLIFKKEILKDVFLICFVFFMCILFGMSMSVLRAGLVYFVRIFYKRLSRISNNVHSLAFAVLIVVFIHPFALYSLVFKLSYASTFGIFVLPPLFDEKFKKYTQRNEFLDSTAQTLYVSLSAFITTLPICVAHFGYVSTVSVAVNLLVSLATTVMLSFNVLAVIFGFIPLLEKLFFIICDMLADYFVKIVTFFGSLDFNTLGFRNSTVLTVLILIIYFIFYITLFKPYKFLKRGGEIADR